MSDERKELTFNQWTQEAVRRFGEDKRKWRFQCPNCKETQSIEDFTEGGMTEENALSYVHFSCIGRYIEGRGCDWTLGGLFQIHKTVVLHQGQKFRTFEFAPEGLTKQQADESEGRA